VVKRGSPDPSLKNNLLRNFNRHRNYIFDALRNDTILSLCRALGIICFIITEPYWKIAADNEISAIQMDQD
jgi:hypothetical protein